MSKPPMNFQRRFDHELLFRSCGLCESDVTATYNSPTFAISVILSAARNANA